MYDDPARGLPARNGLWQRVARAWQAFRSAQPQALPPLPVTFAPSPPVPMAPNCQLRAPSIHQQFHFDISLAVEWRLDGSAANMPHNGLQIAKGGIARRVEKIAATMPISQAQRLWSELEVQLYQPMLIPGTPVFAWAHCDGIAVDPQALEAVHQRDRDGQDVLVQRWIWESQEYRIRYLDSLITDPRRATAWWMLRNEDKIDSMVGTAQQFRALRDILIEDNREPEPQQAPPPVEPTMASLVDKLWANLSEHGRENVGEYLIRLFEGYQQDELAGTARQLLAVSDNESPQE